MGGFFAEQPLQAASSAAEEKLVYPHYLITMETAEKKPLSLNLHTTLILSVDPQTKNAPPVSDLSFDARMPEHKHGMVTKPKISKMADGRFRVEGVRLHMAGKWVFHFVLQHPEGKTEISSPFFVNPK